jgi:hypothetical protein
MKPVFNVWATNQPDDFISFATDDDINDSATDSKSLEWCNLFNVIGEQQLLTLDLVAHVCNDFILLLHRIKSTWKVAFGLEDDELLVICRNQNMVNRGFKELVLSQRFEASELPSEPSESPIACCIRLSIDFSIPKKFKSQLMVEEWVPKSRKHDMSDDSISGNFFMLFIYCSYWFSFLSDDKKLETKEEKKTSSSSSSSSSSSLKCVQCWTTGPDLLLCYGCKGYACSGHMGTYLDDDNLYCMRCDDERGAQSPKAQTTTKKKKTSKKKQL